MAATIIESTNVLVARLRDEGFGWTNPGRAGADECLVECALFEWFVRDVAMSYAFGRHEQLVRRALAGRVLIDLQRSGVSPACLEDFEQRCRTRFAEYTISAGLSASLQPLGALAWARISGGDEPSERMTMLLAVRASAELARLRGLAEHYTIVKLPPSPPPLAGQE